MGRSWNVECQRYFVESKTERKANGEPKMIANDVRKMHIRGDLVFTDYFLVNLLKRKAGNLYSVKERKAPERPWWDKGPIKDGEYKWNREGVYTREQFIKWLGQWIGQDAEGAVVALEVCPPDNLVKLAA
ncbi:hypothetical protein [Nitrospira sp. BLG_2]|uniref:hypothetical protein n=1 Tax=Nitrospira sp. BLG_2 TaxID=3397507 RepID=UPI003B9C4722